jgi:predicted nucleic acid-binding protein
VIFVDSNVIIDVIERDPVWEAWSSAQLEAAGKTGSVSINEIIVAEAAPRGGSLERFVESIGIMGIEIEPITVDAAYRSGVAFQDYRKRRTVALPSGILADFLIGGHAEFLGATILTRDPRFYRSYFPTVPLITPTKDEE